MTCFSGPEIIEDGLVLALDAANPRSYPGSGTVWYDVSGNGNNFQLFNSPSHVGSYFNFDGINDYAKSINPIDLSMFDAVTVEIGLRVNTTVSPSGMAFEHSDNWNTQSMGFGMLPNSSGSTSYVSNSHHTNQLNGSGSLNYTGVIGTTITVHTNIWSRTAGPGRTAYINTVLRGSKETGTYPAFRNDFFYLSTRAGTGGFANHSVYFLKVYGAALTINDNFMNFEATRDRFGI